MVSQIHGVAVSQRWDKDVYITVKEYIESGRAHQHLTDLRKLLHKMRRSLEENFSIQDVLLEIGDKRLDAYEFD